jgi:hypothetical protein
LARLTNDCRQSEAAFNFLEAAAQGYIGGAWLSRQKAREKETKGREEDRQIQEAPQKCSRK